MKYIVCGAQISNKPFFAPRCHPKAVASLGSGNMANTRKERFIRNLLIEDCGNISKIIENIYVLSESFCA